MASLSSLRDGIAANLSTITGLRVSAFIPDNINPPIAIVTPQNIEYHRSFQNG